MVPLDAILQASDLVAVLGREISVRLLDISASGCLLESGPGFTTGSRPTAHPAPKARAGFRPRPAVIISMCRSPARGRIAHHLPQAETPRRRNLAFGRVADDGRAGLDLRQERGIDRRSGQRRRETADICLLNDPKYSGRVTVPVLWDKMQRDHLKNKSSEIIRMLNTASRRVHIRPHRLLSAGVARRDRPHQRSRLSQHQ